MSIGRHASCDLSINTLLAVTRQNLLSADGFLTGESIPYITWEHALQLHSGEELAQGELAPSRLHAAHTQATTAASTA